MSAQRCGHEMDVEVYLLGALDPDERRAFVEHLPRCGPCRDALAAGSGLPGLLARVPEPEIHPVAHERDDPPPEVLTTVIARARGRRRAQLALAGASVVVALVGGVVLGGVLAGPDEGRTGGDPVTAPAAPVAREVPLGSVGGSTTYGRAELAGKPWGTAVDLQCLSSRSTAYPPAPPGAPRTVYVLVARAADGSEQQIARWSPPPGTDPRVTGSIDVPPDRLTALEVRTDDGRVVMAWAT